MGELGRSVDCGQGTALDHDAPLGRHHYRVACAYDAPDGRRLWSPGVVLTAEVAAWPSPVTRLEAHADDAAQTVRVSWQPPDRGSAQVVPWRGAPVAPGAKVPRPAAAPTAATDAVFEVGDRTTTRLTAVSVLGDRAVAGATVLIDAPGVVAELTARRVAPDRAEVRFRWPEPAVLVLVAWEQDGVRRSRRLPRSFCRDVPVELAVTGRPATSA